MLLRASEYRTVAVTRVSPNNPGKRLAAARFRPSSLYRAGTIVSGGSVSGTHRFFFTSQRKPTGAAASFAETRTCRLARIIQRAKALARPAR